MSVDNCPFCGEPLIFEDEYIFGNHVAGMFYDDDSEFLTVRARCLRCKANFHLKYRFNDYEVTGYD